MFADSGDLAVIHLCKKKRKEKDPADLGRPKSFPRPSRTNNCNEELTEWILSTETPNGK